MGLSAIQIGIPERVAVVDIPLQGDLPGDVSHLKLDLVNLVIIEKHSPYVFRDEGCLSIPGELGILSGIG